MKKPKFKIPHKPLPRAEPPAAQRVDVVISAEPADANAGGEEENQGS